MKKKIKYQFAKLTAEKRLYNLAVPIIGLTGGIATGKTAVSNYYKELGHPIICADDLVKKIYFQEESLEFIQKSYSEAIEEGQVNFATLRKIFFNNPDAKNKIENFIYERLEAVFMEEFLVKVEQFKELNFIIYDVALLFEKELNHQVDISLCIYSPREIQIERLLERDAIDQDLAEKILAEQLDIDLKSSLSQFVIQNDSTIEQLKVRAEAAMATILT